MTTSESIADDFVGLEVCIIQWKYYFVHVASLNKANLKVESQAYLRAI